LRVSWGRGWSCTHGHGPRLPRPALARRWVREDAVNAVLHRKLDGCRASRARGLVGAEAADPGGQRQGTAPRPSGREACLCGGAGTASQVTAVGISPICLSRRWLPEGKPLSGPLYTFYQKDSFSEPVSLNGQLRTSRRQRGTGHEVEDYSRQ
jgi:hypothetical protein